MDQTDLNGQNWRGRIFRYAPLILWIGFIAYMSGGQASADETSRFIRPLLEFLFPHAAEETYQFYHLLIRKMAHVTEYGILAFWASRAFLTSGKAILTNYWFIFVFMVVLSIASLDELNQSFDAARTGSIWDVALDCTGGILILIAFGIYRYLLAKRS